MKSEAAESVWTAKDAFRREVRLGAAQVDGLTAAELAAALAYEVEAESGIPAAEAELAFRPILDEDPSVRAFDVAVLRRRSRRPGAFSARWRAWVAVALALLAAGAGADFWRLRGRERACVRELGERRTLEARLRPLRERELAARRTAEALRADRTARESAQREVARLRAAWGDLLAALSTAFAEDAVVRRIERADAFGAKVEAVSLTAQDAVRAMVRLTRAIEPAGWRLSPGPVRVNAPGSTAVFSVDVVFGPEGAR